jgi:glutathione synthase/RimK-type ligase-like ATP-grasp enzyme
VTTIGFLTHSGLPALSPDDRLAAVALERLGIRVEPLVWTAQSPDSCTCDALVLRSTWDYPERIEQFRAWLAAVERHGPPLWNPPATVRWNIDKSYLGDLANSGVDTIPSHHAQPGETLESILDDRGWTDVVIKPRISADAFRTHRVRRQEVAAHRAEFDALVASPNGVVVQPFLPQITTDGEIACIFLGGAYSHTIRRRPGAGDYRVQERFGGTTEPASTEAVIVRMAEAVLDAVTVPWLYARVDGCVVDGTLLVMEVELIEPSLYLSFADGAADRFACAVASVVEPPGRTPFTH